MLDVKKLRVLQELSTRGTLAETADVLGYTPSAVSQQLTALEHECGHHLLQKQGRTVTLTPKARILVEHTEKILHELELAQTALESTDQTPAGTVRLAIFQTAAMALLTDTLEALSGRYPDLRVEALQREPEAALEHTHMRDVDLVVAEQYPHHAVREFPELDSRPLNEDPVMLAVAPESDVYSIADAARSPWVMESKSNASRSWAEHVCRTAGFEPHVRFEFDDVRAHIDLVECGLAVALLPGFAWAGSTPRVRLIELPNLPHRHVFTSARRDMARRPAIEAVRHALEESAAKVKLL
ncbi:LysR substrate-binding domain-containing protein [Rothia uropygialis]|uniref:LysR substrate-binding domain-containing protein n=1 Tax=Kocuria sp. 36 TaxID=1415402 RepID=UPI00101D5FCE|nr:LysR substrate-binding domain-containing protein [Kocuria sp. 36]